jgi:hypothetical protein
MTAKDTKNPLRQFYAKTGALVITATVVVVGALLALVFLLPHGKQIDSSTYQIVYMASGRAYFGKLQNTNGAFLVLNNPYTAQDVAPSDASAPAGKQASTTLVKVSQQTYGPEDSMSLRGDQVLFWQNLRSDSKVVKAIETKQ